MTPINPKTVHCKANVNYKLGMLGGFKNMQKVMAQHAVEPTLIRNHFGSSMAPYYCEWQGGLVRGCGECGNPYIEFLCSSARRMFEPTFRRLPFRRFFSQTLRAAAFRCIAYEFFDNESHGRLKHALATTHILESQ